MLNLIESCYGPNSRLLSVNTDGIFIVNPKQIGKVFEEVKLISYCEKNFRENLVMNDFELNIGEGRIINGPASSRKTHNLIKQFIKEDNPLVLSFTNKDIQNVKERTSIRIRPFDEEVNITEDEINI